MTISKKELGYKYLYYPTNEKKKKKGFDSMEDAYTHASQNEHAHQIKIKREPSTQHDTPRQKAKVKNNYNTIKRSWD